MRRAAHAAPIPAPRSSLLRAAALRAAALCAASLRAASLRAASLRAAALRAASLRAAALRAASPRAASLRAFALCALACGLLACGRDDGAVQVFAASSLTEAFEDLADAFETAHPGARVQLAFAGSQTLRLQIEQGAPADLFASADPAHAEALARAGLAEPPEVLAHNALVVIVPADNPARITRVEDLAQAERLVIGAEGVPVGRYARRMLAQLGARRGPPLQAAIEARVVSEETNTRLVRAKVELGEADAAIVYATDAAPSRAVRAIPIDDAVNVRADYALSVLPGGAEPALARRFRDFALSDAGQAILARHGFDPR